MDYTFRCRACGRLFDATRVDAVTCSPKCRVSWQRARKAAASVGVVIINNSETAERTGFAYRGDHAVTVPLGYVGEPLAPYLDAARVRLPSARERGVAVLINGRPPSPGTWADLGAPDLLTPEAA